jgi:hypothetical protein
MAKKKKSLFFAIIVGLAVTGCAKTAEPKAAPVAPATGAATTPASAPASAATTTVTATAVASPAPTVTVTAVPATVTVTATPVAAPKPAAPVAAPKPAAPAPAAPVAAPKPAAPVQALTASQEQAVSSARDYLSLGSGFSRQSLIDQLSSSFGAGFSVADATVAVDSMNTDWNAQAAMAAKAYLALGSGFSHAGLVEQLDSAFGGQFTPAQAEYGVSHVGL